MGTDLFTKNRQRLIEHDAVMRVLAPTRIRARLLDDADVLVSYARGASAEPSCGLERD